MRIWDVHPGYLNRQSLLGEHRELHGINSILTHGRKGYANHPETLRWAGFGWALARRHRLLAVEMALRGYTDRSPVDALENIGEWPPAYIDEPHQQLEILRRKYETREPGRIPLPRSAQQLWAQHKYSVMARDARLYRELGRSLAGTSPDRGFQDLTRRLTELLRAPPPAGGLRNAVQHMWGYVSEDPPLPKGEAQSWDPARLLAETQRRAMSRQEPYLTGSTALSELAAWLPDTP